MKKVLPIFLSALLLSACSFIAPKTSTGENVQTEKTATEEQSFSGTIQDLIKTGASQKCVWKTTSNDGEAIEGEMVIFGKKFSQTVTISDGKQIRSVSDGQFMYTWGVPDQNKGIKFDFAQMLQKAADSENNASDASAQGQASDLTAKIDFKCSSWNVDESQFAVPANVEFADMTQLVNKAVSAACDICDKLPDVSSREQCKASAKCE